LAKEGRRQGTKGVMNRRTRVRELLQGEAERGMKTGITKKGMGN
jgi:hypothetical protein